MPLMKVPPMPAATKRDEQPREVKKIYSATTSCIAQTRMAIASGMRTDSCDAVPSSMPSSSACSTHAPSRRINLTRAQAHTQMHVAGDDERQAGVAYPHH